MKSINDCYNVHEHMSNMVISKLTRMVNSVESRTGELVSLYNHVVWYPEL